MEEWRRQTAEGKGNFALAYIFLDRGSRVVTSWPIARRQLLELEKIWVTYISLLIEFKWETEFINSSTKPMAQLNLNLHCGQMLHYATLKKNNNNELQSGGRR